MLQKFAEYLGFESRKNVEKLRFCINFNKERSFWYLHLIFE